MAHRYADRVMHATLSTGAGDLVLGQAVSGYQSIADAGIVPGDTMDVCIEDVATGVWETTRATLAAADTISRGEIHDSSAGGARVDFGAGMKRLYLVYPGAVISSDREAAVVARDEAAALVAGFDSTVDAAKVHALDVIASSVAAIIVDSGLATTAAGEAAISADAASDAAGRAEVDGAAASASAVLAKAAADNAAASVTNAAIPRETLVELQSLSGVTEGQLGVVYGAGDDRGVYRYLSDAWAYESDTLPGVEIRVGAVEATIQPDPAEQDRSVVIVDAEGNTSLEMSGDGSEFRVAGTAVRRNPDASVDIERLDGAGLSLRITQSGVQVGGAEQVTAPPGVIWAVADQNGFAALALHADRSVQIGGLRILPGEGDAIGVRLPNGAALIDDIAGVAGMTFEQIVRDDIAIAWADPEGFFGFALRLDGTALGTGLGDSGTDPGAGGQYTEAEIAARNASNLAASAQVARSMDTTAQRPVFRYNLFPSYGQSLSVGFEGWPALSTAPRFTGNLMLGQSVHSNEFPGAGTWSPMIDGDFRPLVATVRGGTGSLLDAAAQAALTPGDANNGETPLEGAMAYLRRGFLDAVSLSEDATRQFVAAVCGVGGTSIAELSKGASPELYQRVLQCAAAVKAKADALSGTFGIPAVLWLQGEQDYTDGTSKAAYKALLVQLVADIRADVQVAIAGQDRPFVFVTYQTGGSYASDANALAVAQAQLELSQEQPNWYLAAPTYPVTDKGGHLDPNGYRWLGQQFGKVLHKVLVLNHGWRPLSPIQATRRGREILLDMHVPEPPLVWDMPYVVTTLTDYAAKGFALRDGDGALAITSVELVAETMVRIVAARDVVGEAFVRYAGKATFNGNGCLRDSDPTTASEDYVYEAGTGQYAGAEIPALIDRPYPLHNWCVAFDLPILDS